MFFWLAGGPHDGIAKVLVLTNVAGSISRIGLICQSCFGYPHWELDGQVDYPASNVQQRWNPVRVDCETTE